MLEVTLPISSNIWLGRLLLQLDPETILAEVASGVDIHAGHNLANEFLVDTVLMSNDDQNPETGASDWIEDVVNRALKVLTDLTRSF